MPYVSIIIPYFRKLNYFKETLTSVNNQTFKNYEVLIVYDDENKEDLNKLISLTKNKKKINSYIIQNKLEKNIILLGHVENVYPLMTNAKLFILSSLWEDPGFVLVEALFCRTLVLASNCKTGPAELIKDKKNGYVFESNNIASFINKFNEFNVNHNNFKLKANGLKMVKKFTLFDHYIGFKKIIL